MDLEIRDPVFSPVWHDGYVSTAASASERERPDVEIFIPGALK